MGLSYSGLIITSLDFSYHGGITNQALQTMGLQRNVSLLVQNFIVLPELLAQSDLLAIVPERLITHSDNLKRFEPPLKIQGFTKTLIWHERTHKDPAYRWVRELIEKAWLKSNKRASEI
ncbi:hypothetical protein DPV99_08510 [Aggregatibacter aphrophilus]|jgi:transcriptional regulator, lysR family|nr:hypothetical protein DPV99_08510 [Aggregatibacter aphrophilus]